MLGFNQPATKYKDLSFDLVIFRLKQKLGIAPDFKEVGL